MAGRCTWHRYGGRRIRGCHFDPPFTGAPMPLLRCTILLCLMVAAPAVAGGQSAVERPPNLNGGWVTLPGVLQFNFLHRFDVSPPPERKVTNSPTFLVGLGLPGRSMLGFNYATNSDLVRGFPNEWEFFGRVMPLRQRAGKALDMALHVGYNQAAASFDGEVTVARNAGRVGLFAAGRRMSNFAWAGESRFAVAGGTTVRLGRWLGVTGDLATLLDRAAREEIAWSAGIQVGIPYTPHSFSIHSTNANTGTLQGASRGTGTVRYGFDYTVPITIRRYLPRRGGDAGPVGAAPLAPAAERERRAAGDPVRAAIGGPDQPLAYVPARLEVDAGTTIVWTNRDPLEHTVTALDGSFDSGAIDPGDSWSHTFREPGVFEFTCTPHPFMRGVVIVRAQGTGGER
jgi:plastocyanin